MSCARKLSSCSRILGKVDVCMVMTVFSMPTTTSLRPSQYSERIYIRTPSNLHFCHLQGHLERPCDLGQLSLQSVKLRAVKWIRELLSLISYVVPDATVLASIHRVLQLKNEGL